MVLSIVCKGYALPAGFWVQSHRLSSSVHSLFFFLGIASCLFGQHPSHSCSPCQGKKTWAGYLGTQRLILSLPGCSETYLVIVQWCSAAALVLQVLLSEWSTCSLAHTRACSLTCPCPQISPGLCATVCHSSSVYLSPRQLLMPRKEDDDLDFDTLACLSQESFLA